MKRTLLVAAVAMAFLVAGGSQPASAQDEALLGTIETQDDEPIAGVVIFVTDADGQEVGTATADENGDWRIGLPGPGEYTVGIDQETLPEGVELRSEAVATTTLTVRTGQERRVLFPIGAAVAGESLFDSTVQRLMTGIKIGLIIAITSVGLSLVFGTTGLINFAHGELVTFGAIVAWFLNVTLGIDLIFAAILAAIIGAMFGASLDVVLFAPLRRRGITGFQFLVITIGLALFLQHIFLIWFGSEFHPYGDYARQATRDFGPIRINVRDIIVMVLSVLVLVAVATMLQRTRLGRAMRAVADDTDLAEASGVDVGRVVRAVWALSAGLAAIGGVFLGLITNVQYLMGFRLLLLMFAAVILGGLGSAYGAMVGGLLVGIVSEVSTLWLRVELKSVWALLVLIIVLLVRPQGILGTRERVG